ncbi:hypothetical protein WN943_026417 [Citrus x changshan-huyou]
MGASLMQSLSPGLKGILCSFIALCLLAEPAFGITRHCKFDIKLQNATRLCHTKSIVSVNGKFPGPRIVEREGDQLLIKVVKHAWHWTASKWMGGWTGLHNTMPHSNRAGLRLQLHHCWPKRQTLVACTPIVAAVNTLPSSFFPSVTALTHLLSLTRKSPSSLESGSTQILIPEAIFNQALQTGGGPNVSDAYAINGLPGPFYNCSAKGGYCTCRKVVITEPSTMGTRRSTSDDLKGCDSAIVWLEPVIVKWLDGLGKEDDLLSLESRGRRPSNRC